MFLFPSQQFNCEGSFFARWLILIFKRTHNNIIDFNNSIAPCQLDKILSAPGFRLTVIESSGIGCVEKRIIRIVDRQIDFRELLICEIIYEYRRPAAVPVRAVGRPQKTAFIRFSLLITRLKGVYPKAPTHTILQPCTQEISTILAKFQAIMKQDYATISKI